MDRDLLLLIIALLAVTVVALLAGAIFATLRARKTNIPGYCTFPGCIAVRRQIRDLAAQYPDAIPTHLVLALIDGIEAAEHHS